MTPSTGGLLAHISPRANESLRGGGLSSSGEAAMRKEAPSRPPESPLASAKLSRVALGDLKLTDRPLRSLDSVFTVSAGFSVLFWASEVPEPESFSFVDALLFDSGIANRPSSESSSESSCGLGERWKETSVSSKSNSGP